MDKPSLSSLPPELQDNIASHVIRKRDLKSLCLASKALYDAALPRLYHSVKLDLDDPFDNSTLATFLDHPGHKHIRQLVFFTYSFFPEFDGDLAEEYEERIRKILQVLPRDKLEVLVTPPDLTLGSETYRMIATQQRCLKHLSFGPVEEAGSHALVKPLQNIQSIDLPPVIGDIKDLRNYGYLLNCCLGVKNLAIRTQEYSLDEPGSDETPFLQDTVDEDGAIFETLFNWNHVNTRKRRHRKRPFAIQKLLLHSQALGYAPRTLNPYIAIETLRELQLHDCSSVAPFLNGVAKHFEHHGAALKVFSFRRTNSVPRSEIESIHGFLKSFQGLQYLELCWESASIVVHPDCIAKHLPTLTDVYFGIRSPTSARHRRLVWHENSYGTTFELATKCPNLRQVAIALPTIKLHDLDKGGWGKLGEELDVLLSANISVLRILNWPEDASVDIMEPTARETYLRRVDAFATAIMQRAFKHGGHCRLKLVCIGSSRIHDFALLSDVHGSQTLSDLRCACYFPGRQTHIFGREEMVAVPVQADQVKLDYPLWDAVSTMQGYRDYGLGAADYELLGRV